MRGARSPVRRCAMRLGLGAWSPEREGVGPLQAEGFRALMPMPMPLHSQPVASN
jgi:hypothetical protein